MNQKETIELLNKLKIRKDSYSFSCNLPNESYCLCYDNNNWQYYYSERGQKTGLKIFGNEHDACLYLLERLSWDFPVIKSFI